MANSPGISYQIPGYYGIPDATIIEHGDAQITINWDGKILIHGPVKDAAMALMKYVVDEGSSGVVSMTHNNCLHIDYKDGINISYVGREDDKPPLWDELMSECTRIQKLMAFW